MNPINDEALTKDLTDIQKPAGLEKSINLSYSCTGNCEQNIITANVEENYQQEIKEKISNKMLEQTNTIEKNYTQQEKEEISNEKLEATESEEENTQKKKEKINDKKFQETEKVKKYDQEEKRESSREELDQTEKIEENSEKVKQESHNEKLNETGKKPTYEETANSHNKESKANKVKNYEIQVYDKNDNCKENTYKIESPIQEIKVINEHKKNEENHESTAEDTNGTEQSATETEFASDEEIECYENIEDIEIPEEQEVDEIIVPDEAEAEDLTDGKYNDDMLDKSSLHEEDKDNDGYNYYDDDDDDDDDVLEKSLSDDVEKEEEETSAASEIEENEINEEGLYKGNATVEKDEVDRDKKSLNSDNKGNVSMKDYDEDNNDDSCTEPDIVALEENTKNTDGPLEEPKSNEPHIDEDTTSQAPYDPLNCTDNKEPDNEDNDTDQNEENSSKSQKIKNIAKDVVANDDEDDEVQFVETRNSPICIESDDDDNNTKEMAANISSNNKIENNRIIATAPTTVNVSKNIIVTRTSARKSTAKPQHNQTPAPSINNSPNKPVQMQNKSKNVSYLQRGANPKKRVFITGTSTQKIVDCIELLDSSDEESASARNKSTPQQRTPQKRTLLAAKGNYYKNNNKNITTILPNRLPNNFSSHVRQQAKKPAPPPLPPPTPQSNFLNAVQLQPASVTGSNPPAFSALLSNKSVIIPNAFYGNPPNISPELELERRYARWLENFLNQFCKPQFVATHSCFVFLQRALKYKDFVRIKALRSSMNSHTQNYNNQLNIQLMADLKTIFLKNTKKITNYGRRFCELTCSVMPGKSVALIAHSVSGKVTLKTCNMDVPRLTESVVASSTSSSPYSGTNSLTRKRQLDEDEDEYTPDKSKFKTKGNPPSENGDEDSNEMSDDRKRSLRTKRTKRLDNSFSYNEDDLLAEYEIDDEEDEKLAQMEIQRKIEQKRLEAQQQRQQQVKSFESAFIQAFAKNLDTPTTSTKPTKTTKNATVQRVRLKNTTTATVTSIRQYTANNDAEDLLQATWIENVENDDTQIISDDDEPKEHRIYKQQQQQDYYAASSTKLSNRHNTYATKSSSKVSKRNQEEIITGDDDYEDNTQYANNPSNTDSHYWPKNIDAHMSVNGKYKDRCIICNLNCQRLVHHYVNEHRGCEVYNSRLSSSQIKLLKQGSCTLCDVSLYKNGQYQYEAFCIFCQKKCRFMFPYWYQHFTMHTGEYAYRCKGCGIRKPTRSLLTQHQAQGCPEIGGVAQDYAHDSKSLQIEAKVCNLCNYIQLHRSNIVKHLHTQHNIKQILLKHIQTIVLMKAPASMTNAAVPATTSPSTKRFNYRKSSLLTPDTYIIEDDDNANEIISSEIIPEQYQPPINAENQYYNYIPPYMQAAVSSGNFSFEDVDPVDDLSFMICGMLDVQMNPEAN